MRRGAWFAVLFFAAAGLLLPVRADALPMFADRTGLSCDACHGVGTALTDFGIVFARSGYRLPNLGVHQLPAMGLKGSLVFSSDPEPGNRKLIVDELDALSSGVITHRLSYSLEAYWIDGAQIGATRELWLAYWMPTHLGADVSARITIGQMILPLPVDPERYRETTHPYTIFDQSVAANPFSLGAPHNAVMLALGNEVRGTSGALLAVQAHDEQSGLPAAGTDTMVAIKHALRGFDLAFYRYDGSRSAERFSRFGYAANVYRGRLGVETLLQTGSDRFARGMAIASSGGYAQARWAVRDDLFALLRFDATSSSDGAFARSLTLAAGKRIGNALRLVAEDVIAHRTATTHTLNLKLSFGVSTQPVGSGSY